MNPTVKIVKIELAHMVATSEIGLGGSYNGLRQIESRRGRMDRTWDDYVDEDDFE